MAVAKPYGVVFDTIGNRPRRPQPRPTKELSWELANHAKSYLEAGEYATGYGFLHSLLSAGTSITTPAKPYVGMLAPAAYIAFASSLIVYPAITTKSSSAETVKGSDAALRYLQCIYNTVEGPAYKVVRKALSFPDDRSRRRGPKHGDGSPSPGAGGDIERLDTKGAGALSVWNRADDFWHIAGWAFNCSIVHKKRWTRWKLWLEVMLDLLEADWDTCCEESNDATGSKESLLQDSLIWRYISSEQPTQRSTRRRIVGAVLALGNKTSLSQYPEVWNKETMGPKSQKDDSMPAATLDLENGELGDYVNEDEDTIMMDAPEQDAPKRRGRPRKSAITFEDSDEENSPTSPSDGVAALGGRDSIELRQRLIALIAYVAQELPDSFTSLEDFCDDFTEILRGDDVHASAFGVLISTSRLPPAVQFALNGNFLLTYVASEPPNYFLQRPTQNELEEELMPLRATSQSYTHNAKISLILEQMFLSMMKKNWVEWTESLQDAVETGIEARQKVFGSSRGRKGNAKNEETSKAVMEDVSNRLMGLVEILGIAAGREPQTWPRSSNGSPLSSSSGSESGIEVAVPERFRQKEPVPRK
ncbi:unnamed protein product [Periconia digitata]|uniref:Uncharacterized protein n=1 Tax=Periconia digitata TaxID=1303443 RepID=A0A9W4U8F4_9PLEO|nr:unnamed protein product [Periconia digitata]